MTDPFEVVSMYRLLALVWVLLAALPALAQVEKQEPAKLFQRFEHPIGDFLLQESSGDFFRPGDLKGKVWVVQFFYPGCNFCSKNTPTMQELQKTYRGQADVRLVSIALNGDSAETLRAFADDHGAEPGQWLFLTGPADKVHGIIRDRFADTVYRKNDPTPGDQIAHSMRLFLIDARGNAAGYVVGTEEGAAEALKPEIDRLRVLARLERPIPIRGEQLPWFNALLNSACTVLLLSGWILIRLGFQTLHKIVMLLALAVSMIFLSSYLFYHFVVLEAQPMRFSGEGTVRYVYFAILLSHTILAITVAPLALFITVQGLRNALASHKRVARWTLPIWLYVSVTGVVVYWMLYRAQW
jgi:protein SCO1